MNGERYEAFKTRLKWKIYNKEFKQISKFSYSAFKFKFKMTNQVHQEEFAEFICGKNDFIPSDVCNFFIRRNIRFAVGFTYVKGLGAKGNLTLFNHVLFLNRQKLKIAINKFKNNYKFVPSLEKKLINGKNRWDFLLQVFNVNRRTLYFIQADSNVWWKPKRKTETFDKGYSVSCGWLFVQIGKIRFNKKEENQTEKETNKEE